MFRSLLSAGLGLGPAPVLASWSVDFRPEELAAAPDLLASVSTIEWSVKAICALLAICFYVFAGRRAASGDYVEACLSFVGSTVIAIAPYLFIGV